MRYRSNYTASRKPIHGFALIELLVVISIIALLMGMSRSIATEISEDRIMSDSSTTIYSVKGDAIVRYNGDRYHNRPLYCNRMPGFVLAGDLPHVRFARDPYVYGCLMIAVARDGKGKWLHEFSDIVSHYRPGRMEWNLKDSSLDGVTVTLEVVPMADVAGLSAHLVIKGTSPGDKLIWAYGAATRRPAGALITVAGGLDPMCHPELISRGFVAEDCCGNEVKLDGDMFIVNPPAYSAYPMHTITGVCSVASTMVVADAQAWKDPVQFAASSGEKTPIVCGTVPLVSAENELFWAVEAFVGYEASKSKHLGSPAGSFEAGMRRMEAVGRRVVVDTPEPRLDAAVSAACHAIDGIIRPPVFLHGAMQWNIPYLGWRTIYGPTAFGWHEEVKASAQYYISFQEKDSSKKTAHADPKMGYSHESSDSRFYGRGRIQQHNHMYDMQSVFFDMIIHSWRWTGDPNLEKVLRPALDLHLEWIRDCFDPDDDGVYESYMNTAEIDRVWYNGGGTAEESAYAYSGHLAAMDMARRAGDEKAARFHRERAKKIRRGMMQSLWITEKGYIGAYREQSGYKRVHEDSWLYSIFLPIDAAMLTLHEAVQALYYTEWGLERVKKPFGGELCWTSNWVPGAWSNRMLWPAHSYSLALAYYQTGLSEPGWQMLKGNFINSLYNEVVPGGFSSGSTGTDFHDVSSMFCRTVVEGLFGYKPDYPNGVVRCAPQFPSAWNYASIITPDVSFKFNRGEGVDNYYLELKEAAKVDFQLPVRVRKLIGVKVDGKAVSWKITAGFGQSVICVQLPRCKSARLTINWSDPLPQYEPIFVEGASGQQVRLQAKQGKIMEFKDPQGALANSRIDGGDIIAKLTKNAGYHLVLAMVDISDVKQWHIFKIKVTDPEAEARIAAKLVKVIPKDAKWECLDIKNLLNGDIRTIYKQQYLSPRPQTCSVRLGSDGYSPWTFYHWGTNVPIIDLSNVVQMLDANGRLVTPQGVPFVWPEEEERNIAFTSQWDNWPCMVTVPVDKKGDAVWFLICGSTNSIQTGIANAELRMKYADGVVEKLDIVAPNNFWSLCPAAGGVDYNYERDAFALPKTTPAIVQLGGNCRAMVLSWRLRPGVVLGSVTLETLSQEVVVGLMGLTIMEGN